MFSIEELYDKKQNFNYSKYIWKKAFNPRDFLTTNCVFKTLSNLSPKLTNFDFFFLILFIWQILISLVSYHPEIWFSRDQ